MLGKYQKELLRKNWCSPVSGYHNLVYFSDRYFNSRETGRGYPVFLAIVHNETGDKETVYEVARCEYQVTCEQKVKEIKQFLSQLEDEWLERIADE